MQKKKTIILDVDGVLLNWMSNLPLFCRSMGLSTEITLKAYNSSVHYDPRDLFGTCDLSQALKLINMYNESRYGRYLPAYGDAVRVLPKLAEKYHIICVSAFGETVEAWCNRRGNLEAFFPGCVSDLITIDMRSKKSRALQELKQDDDLDIVAFVDDQDTYIEQATEVFKGTDTKVFKLNRNSGDSDFISFDQLAVRLSEL